MTSSLKKREGGLTDMEEHEKECEEQPEDQPCICEELREQEVDDWNNSQVPPEIEDQY